MDSAKNLMKNDKLCLYCDRTFSNLDEQEKHVEREHLHSKSSNSKGSRRKSERIIIKNNSDVEPFRGCFYCSNRKLTSRCDDLESLYQHILVAHKDVCFVCKCRVRWQSKSAFLNHMKICKFSDKRDEEPDQGRAVSANKRRKYTKKMQEDQFNNVVVQCKSLSDSAGTSTHHTTRTNAMNKKSENLHNSHNVLNKNSRINKTKTRKLASSSSSTISSCSSSKASEEYTIPLTRQKNKDPILNIALNKNRNSSNKKTLKLSSPSSSILQPNQPSVVQTSMSSQSASKVIRVKSTKSVNTVVNNVSGNSEVNESVTSTSITAFSKPEAQNNEFDEDFYKKITYNIRMNLNCFIDGKADRLWNNKFQIENITSIKQTEVQSHEKEIHEATNFEVPLPPFPALLTAEQYGFGDSNPQKNKRKFTKNSWKWRWDLIKKYKYVNEGGKIVKKVKQITTGLKDLSQLDMWTQLSMRSRYENLNGKNEFDNNLGTKVSRRLIKSQNIDQLNDILDKRLIPEIHVEQMQQTLVKEELVEYDDELPKSPVTNDNTFQFLQLTKVHNNTSSNSVSLSGEWARPRCFICIDCGQEFDFMKSLNDHKNSEHPYVVSAHYEVVGRENLQHKLYKNLFLPKKALNAIVETKNLSICNESKSNEGSNSSQHSSSITDQKEKECTKCQKIIKYNNYIDIYRHILDCVEDKVWMQAKRRNKYRRSRRKPKKNSKKIQQKLGDQKRNELILTTNNNTDDGNVSFNLEKTDIDKNTKTITEDPPASKTFKNSPMGENYIHSDERVNIKSFFRVSKTTPPNLPQKMVVQMLQMPNNHTVGNPINNSLKQSLRSSTKKQIEIVDKDGKFDETKCIVPMRDVINENNEETLANVISKDSFEINASNIIPLHINTPEKSKSALSSPTNSVNSSLISPTSCSSVPKKKKKLNDCIAMLTCKIQEKLGVNFFENTTNEIFPSETHIPQEHLKIEQEPKNTSLLNEQSTLKADEIYSPEQDEVIDLSVKRTSEIEHPQKYDVNEESNIRDFENAENEPTIFVSSEKIDSNLDNEELTLESFKISIARDKIPNFDEILEKQTKNTAKSLNISESERKAFEEQKHRIMKILGKKPMPKVVDNSAKLNVQNKAKRTRTRNTKVKIKNDISEIAISSEKSHILDILSSQEDHKTNEVKSIDHQLESKELEQRIDRLDEGMNISRVESKNDAVEPTTSTIASGKSILTDPVAKLKGNIEKVIKTTNRIRCRRLSVVVDPILHLPGFQKNRKIRLTNNSQQNGFYDLLTNDHIFNTLKNTPQIKNEIQKLGVKKRQVNESLMEGKSCSKETKATIKKAKKKSSKYANGKVMKVTRKKKKKSLVQKDLVMSEKIGKNKTCNPIDKSKSQIKDNESNVQKLTKTLTKTCQPELKQTKQQKVESEGKVKNIVQDFSKNLPPQKLENKHLDAKTTRKKNVKKLKNKKDGTDDKLDVSSDASLDNDDIPLAKLLASTLDKGQITKDINLSLNKQLESHKSILDEVDEDAKINKMPHNLEDTEKCSNNTNATKEIIPKNNICEIKNNEEVFVINEDSFFNDDNEIDQTNDKINALVTNIINSSELIDSENEKNDGVKQTKSPNCSICMKTFRNDKVLEKHKKTNTHILKEKRKQKQNLDRIQSMDVAETKVFRTKGALKTFENMASDSAQIDELKSLVVDEFKPIVEDSTSFIALKDVENLDDEDEELSTKDRIFDSLFSNIENKLQAAAKNDTLPKFDFPVLSHHDSESSTATSWDLKHDAELEWDAGAPGIFEAEINTKPQSTCSISNNQENASISRSNQNMKNKLSKIKEKDVAVPTKSLIMGKIFKKHRDKLKTPQADAPNNKPSKNSLDEIFDHLKNSAEIDDKVLTCPSPKTLLNLNSTCATFSKSLSNTNDVLESASCLNNRNTHSLCLNSTLENDSHKFLELKNDEVLDGIGKRKSRRRCAIKMKTFAETWSSDEYEELHDNDIIRLINEIEKRESSKKRKDISGSEMSDKKYLELNHTESITSGKIKGLKKARVSHVKKSGHKSDDETKTKNTKFQETLKKRRMSCFVGKNDEVNFGGFENKVRKKVDHIDPKISLPVTKSEYTPTINNNQLTPTIQQNTRRRNIKHRKKPRSKVKNIAYDSDSDFELNLKKKQKSAANSEISESEQEGIKDKSTITTIKELKKQHFLSNDLNVAVAQTAANPKSAMLFNNEKQNFEVSTALQKSEQERIFNRTKRHSSEKLYYWSSSSESSDEIEQGDIPERGGIEDTIAIAQQQHGWIVGDSHKKLVTLLAHAKIKNKIN